MKRPAAQVELISRTVLVFAIGFGGASFVLAAEPTSPPASSPTVQQEKGTQAESGQVQERTVSLTQAVHFTDAKGQDVVVGPGSYRVDPEGTDRIHLLPAGTAESTVIDAVSFTHQQAVERPVPVTVPDPQQPDVLHLVLLFPGGTGLDAIGTYSGVKPRAVTKAAIFMQAVQLAPTQTMQLMATVAAPSVVIYEHPNFGGRSQTLGVGGYIFSDLNDLASSIGVPAGLVAVLYEHVDAGGGYGRAVDVLEDRPDLSQVNFNDTLSYVCVFSSPDPQGYIWARASVQNGQFVAGHWERQRVGGTPVNSTAVVAPPLPPHPANAPPASCGGGPIVRDHRTPPPKPDLVGRKISSSGCGPGRIGMALIEVKNQGTMLAGAFFTEVNSFSKLTRFRTGQLPPGGAFTHQIQVGCPPQGPCPINGRVDADGEVTESNESNNLVSFTCP